MDTQRLDKFLANNGVCARRAVESLLASKIVTVNGKRVSEPGVRIKSTDIIRIDGAEIKKPKLVYFLLNKPKGYISTTSDEKGRKNVLDLVKTSMRIYPVGRLDRQTSGLLILTNDGEFTNKLTHPKFEKDKTYKLTIKGKITNQQLNPLKNGVMLEDGMTAPAKCEIISSNSDETIIEITIHEGKNRQIRRMCEALGIKLIELERVAIGQIRDTKLASGKFRELSNVELKTLIG
jgi:23S rRNA pseudouridine2605 synthase